MAIWSSKDRTWGLASRGFSAFLSTSGHGQSPQKFIERFTDLATDGRGDDPDYARWYKDMLEITEPDGLLCVYADWPSPGDCLSIFHGSMDIEIPLPPPAIGSN